MSRRNTVAFVRKMQEEEYTQKQIKMVTKIPQSTLSRIMNYQTYVTIKPQHYDKDAELEQRLSILNKILNVKEIEGGMGLDDNNKKYIKLLQFLGVELKEIKEVYYDVSKKLINNEWNFNNVDFRDFDSTIIGVSAEDFEDLIGGL